MTIAHIITPKEKDIGDFSVRRALPASVQKMVGPWIFFDHMGPAEFPAGQGINVRPHPHINLATVTYLFEGEILHRDSLGSVQSIKPGDINLMVAGSGMKCATFPTACTVCNCGTLCRPNMKRSSPRSTTILRKSCPALPTKEWRYG